MERDPTGPTRSDDAQWTTASQVFGTLSVVGVTVGGVVGRLASGTWEAAGAGAAVAAVPALLIGMAIVFRPFGTRWVVPSLSVATLLTAVAATGVAGPVAWSMRSSTPSPAPDVTSPGPAEATTPGHPLPTAPTPSLGLSSSPTPSPTGSATPTPDSIVVGWPTGANDGPPALWIYFGTEFFAPDWVSCEGRFCLVGEGEKIHVYRLRPIERTRTFRADVPDPYAALIAQNFTPAQARALLKLD